MTRVMMKDNLGAEQTGRWFSPNIWGDCPIEAIKNGTVIGRFFQDDFTGPCPNTDAGLYEQTGESCGLGYLFYGDTGVLIKAQAAVEEGVVQASTLDTTQDESVMSTGSPSFIVSDTASEAKKLWFEARVSRSTIANEGLAMFIGLAWDHGSGVSVAKNASLTDTAAALGAFSFLGFHVDQADGDAMDFTYKADSQTAAVVKAGVEVPEASTFVKVGFVYDPNAPDAKQIAIFINNVEQTTYVTATQIAAATFPDAEPMAMAWCLKVGTGATGTAEMDWWRGAQLG